MRNNQSRDSEYVPFLGIGRLSCTTPAPNRTKGEGGIMATIVDGGVVVEEIGQGADAGRCEVEELSQRVTLGKV